MRHSVTHGKIDENTGAPSNTRVLSYLLAALCLIAIAPLFQSLATWDRDGKLAETAFVIRHLSLPTVVIEIFIVYIASRGGFDPAAVYRNLELKTKIAIIVWSIFAVFTTFFVSSDILSSLFILMRYFIHCIVLCCLVFLVLQSENFNVKKWIEFLTIGALLYLISLLVFVYLTRNSDSFPWALRLPSATNIRQIGNLLSILAIAPITALLARDHSQKAYYFLAVSLIIAFVTWTGTRGGMLGLALGSTLGIIATFKFTSLRNIALLTTSWVGGALFSIPFFRPAADFGLFRMVKTVTTDQQLSPGRTEMWRDTFFEILQNPFLGYGSGNFRQNMLEKYHYDFNHPHNVILQYIYDWGIFGGLAALVILLSVGGRLLASRPQGSAVRFLAIAAFCTTLTIAMIEGTLFHPLPILMTIAMISPALGLASKSALRV